MSDPQETSDAALLAAFAHGDAAAMDRLVERYRRPLFGWFVGMVSDRATAEDLYQDVWLKIIRNAAAFNDVSFRAWMWKIARNRLIDHRRKMRPDLTLDAPVAADDDNAPSNVDVIPDSRANVRQEMEGDERVRALRAAVARLPLLHREIVLLRTQGGLTFQEIADQLGIPLNTALGRMHDATEKLKTILAADAQS